MTPADLKRFFAKVQVQQNGCWLWTGAFNGRGYGNFKLGETMCAHVASFEFFVAPVPDGYELDHFVCQTPACVNPDHLEPVPVAGRENTVRYQALRTECMNGHPRVPANLIHKPDGRRECRACDVLAQRRKSRLAGKPSVPARQTRLILTWDDVPPEDRPGRLASKDENHAGIREAMATLGVTGDRNPDEEPFPIDDGTTGAYDRAEARISTPDTVNRAMR